MINYVLSLIAARLGLNGREYLLIPQISIVRVSSEGEFSPREELLADHANHCRRVISGSFYFALLCLVGCFVLSGCA